MLASLAIALIVFLKFAIPVGIVFAPFTFGWANFVLDTIDGDLLIPLGLSDPVYQPIDKLADWFTYVGMVLAARRHKWEVRNWIYALFIFRSIGQIAFFVIGDERVFFVFQNLLEPLFLVYATIVVFRKAKAYDFYRKHRIAIWVFVILYKFQDEWVTHVGNIDRSELIKNLFS